MSAFTIEVKDEDVRAALKALGARVNNMAPVLQGVGDRMVERTKRRFATSTAPDGTPWKPNSAATLGMLTARLAGASSNRKKDGSLNAKGNRALASKKPLIASGTLMDQIVASATASSLTVATTSATTGYAAMQQWGGTTAPKSMIPGKTIPARPYMPIRKDGMLYPQESVLILGDINTYLMEGLT